MLLPSSETTDGTPTSPRLVKRRGFALVGTVGVLAVLALMVDGMVQRAAIERKALIVERQNALRTVAFANVAAAMGLRHASEERHRAALREALRGACDIDPSVVNVSVWIVPDQRLDANTASEAQIVEALMDVSRTISDAAPVASPVPRVARRIVRARVDRPFENAAEMVHAVTADESAEARSFIEATVPAVLTTDGEPVMVRSPKGEGIQMVTLGSLVTRRRLLVRLLPDRHVASSPHAAALQRTHNAANWKVRAATFRTHYLDWNQNEVKTTCGAR